MRSPFPLAGLAVLLLTSPASSAAPHTHVVVIDQMKFGPLPRAMRVGDRILWVNRDLFRHTATAGDNSFDVDLPPGARKSSVITISRATTVVCRYHPGMRTSFKASR